MTQDKPDHNTGLAEATESFLAARKQLIASLVSLEFAARGLGLAYIADNAEEMRSDVILATRKTPTIKSDVIAFFSNRAKGYIPG